MQLTFKLPEINREETRKAVESALEQYQYLLLLDMDLEPKVTSSLKLVSVAPSNQFHSSTEDVAIERLELEHKSKKYINWIMRAVNRLHYYEREIIVKRYLGADEIFDYELYNELGYSESKYYRIKSRAFYKLAFLLKLEVYKEVKASEGCTTNT